MNRTTIKATIASIVVASAALLGTGCKETQVDYHIRSGPCEVGVRLVDEDADGDHDYATVNGVCNGTPVRKAYYEPRSMTDQQKILYGNLRFELEPVNDGYVDTHFMPSQGN